MTEINADLLQQLIDAQAAALTLYARQWCSSPDDAVQEALIDLLRQQPAPENPVGWLYTTVRRKAMNLGRSERRRVRHHQLASQQRESWFLPAEHDLDEPLDWQKLLYELPRLEREIVVARIWGELPFAQIAELVEQSVSTVHRRYQRALAELQRLMPGHEPSSQTNETGTPR